MIEKEKKMHSFIFFIAQLTKLWQLYTEIAQSMLLLEDAHSDLANGLAYLESLVVTLEGQTSASESGAIDVDRKQMLDAK